MKGTLAEGRFLAGSAEGSGGGRHWGPSVQDQSPVVKKKGGV